MNTRRPRPNFPRPARERGAVLLVALIFLILLTLLAIGASSGSLLQQRMVSATRNAQLARMSADTALRGVEWNLWSWPLTHPLQPLPCSRGALDSTTGCVYYDPNAAPYGVNGVATRFRTSNNVWYPDAGTPIGLEYKGADGSTDFTNYPGAPTAKLAANPRFIIENMGPVRPPGAGPQHESGATSSVSNLPGQVRLEIYRITARATGGNKNAVRVAQSTFDAQTN